MNILFLNAGRRVELIRAFRNSFIDLGIDGRIITTDVQPMAPAFHLGDVKKILPHSSSLNFVVELNKVCEAEKVALIIPLIDSDLLALSKLKKEFNGHGITVLISPTEVIETCRDKLKTSIFLGAHGFSSPSAALSLEKFALQFPVVVKPRDGSSGINIFKASTMSQLESVLEFVPNPMIQECVRGEEITTDVYSDENGNPRLAVPRLRLKVRGGEVAVGKIKRDSRLELLCMDIANELGAIGPINIQTVSAGSEHQVIEINPRFGGGCPLSFAAGAPFVEWTIALAQGKPIEKIPINIEDGKVMMRFDESLFFSSEELACL